MIQREVTREGGLLREGSGGPNHKVHEGTGDTVLLSHVRIPRSWREGSGGVTTTGGVLRDDGDLPRGMEFSTSMCY